MCVGGGGGLGKFRVSCGPNRTLALGFGFGFGPTTLCVFLLGFNIFVYRKCSFPGFSSCEVKGDRKDWICIHTDQNLHRIEHKFPSGIWKFPIP